MNPSARFSQLRDFVLRQGLSREEIRYLSILLSNTRPDIIGELPLEIIVLVTLQLSPREFARCLGVSKTWRERFLSQAVMAAYTKRYWPAMINGAVNRRNFLEALSKLGWGVRSVAHFGLTPDADHESVAWDQTSHYQLDPIFHNQLGNLPEAYTQYRIQPWRQQPYTSLNDPTPPTAVYAFGKVACHLCGCVVVVDDLTSKTRKVLTPPRGMMNGSALKLHALGSRLVVASIDRLLVAWDHVSNQVYETSLPSRVLRCTTQDDRVAIILYGGDILIWTPGHKVLQLDSTPLTLGLNPPAAKTWKAYLEVFFDIRDRNTIFLASRFSFREASNYIDRVIVHVFSMTDNTVVTHAQDKKRLPSPYIGGPGDDATNRRIRIEGYEFDRSCIFFSSSYVRGGLLAVFDKLERKFSDGPEICRYKDPQDYLFPFATDHFAGKVGIDLDFLVCAQRDCYAYTVVQSSRPKTPHQTLSFSETYS
ncbi:hypothetical protein GGR55DRAFT_164123 [Xylaria sp. FL0064]|nr:hypothetical protein GGR55DRAFT_164123 [Xylaria sp. FL0064]